jgi:hypothetical protein
MSQLLILRNIFAIISIITISQFIQAPKILAGEPLFGYVYTTDTVPKGKWEVEQWITDRDGQAAGFFHHFDMRTEAEYGITDNFQLAVYANYFYAFESANSVRGKTEGLELPYNFDSSQTYNQGRWDGLSLEAEYRFLSPYIDPFGFAFYIEPAFSYRENGLEFRSIFQKNFFDDLLVLALNVWVEFDREQGSNLVEPGSDEVPDGAWNNATYMEYDLGGSYRFMSNWYAGLEGRIHNEYQGWTLSRNSQAHTAYFFGPNIHYGSEHWFFTISFLRQLGALPLTDEQQAQTVNGKLYGDEHTNWDGIRLKVGVPF